MMDERDRSDNKHSTDSAEPTENAEPNDPTDPTDNAEPMDPIDRIEFLDPMLNSEFSDHNDQRLDTFIIQFYFVDPAQCERVLEMAFDGIPHQPVQDRRAPPG